jgi:hypothetical protein
MQDQLRSRSSARASRIRGGQWGQEQADEENRNECGMGIATTMNQVNGIDLDSQFKKNKDALPKQLRIIDAVGVLLTRKPPSVTKALSPYGLRLKTNRTSTKQHDTPPSG